MQKPLAVANWFISTGVSHKSPPTQMKLQKLMFFAHGWNLALYEAPLVSEQFQAWKYGPVIPSVYHEFKHFGVAGITQFGTEIVPNGQGFQYIAPSLIESTGQTNALLSRIWEVFGKYSGNQLSQMTHQPDTPWKLAREGYPKDQYDIPIHNKNIELYFKQLMSKEQ